MELINSYAIVAYVAGPVARFVDRLRADLSDGIPPHAHITVLPPRPLTCTVAEATEFANSLLGRFDPIEVRLGAVEVFEQTQVIHLSLASGEEELQALHEALNTGLLVGEEPHRYVPHITLGQFLPPETLEQAVEKSQQRWEAAGPMPPLRIEMATLVQQRADLRWEDLAELELGRVARTTV